MLVCRANDGQNQVRFTDNKGSMRNHGMLDTKVAMVCERDNVSLIERR